VGHLALKVCELVVDYKQNILDTKQSVSSFSMFRNNRERTLKCKTSCTHNKFESKIFCACRAGRGKSKLKHWPMSNNFGGLFSCLRNRHFTNR
jgi:hypothetical protein